MAKITQSDDLESAILKLACGVGAAMEILAKTVNEEPNSESETKISGIDYLLLLDKLEIYGTGIYILYKDKCHGDLGRLQLLLRAAQQGVYPASKLQELAADQFNQVSVSEAVWRELGYVMNG